MKRRQGLTVGLVLLLICTLAMPVYASSLSNKQSEYQKVQEQIRQMEQRINANQKQSKSIGSELNRLEREIHEAEQKLGYLHNRLQTTALEIDAAEKELAEAQKNLDFRQEMLKTRIRALYERGSVSYLEVLLNARSFSDLVNRVVLLQRVVAQDVAVVDSIKLEKARIEEKKSFLDAKRVELAGLYRDTESHRTAIASRKAERGAYKNKLDNDRAEYQRALRELEATERELERLIRQAQGSNPGTGTGTGKYTWPTPGYSKINSYFGNRKHPIFGGNNFHAGIDIGAPMGAKIVAADAGKVLYAGWMTGYGQVVILDHGGGRSTVYAHASVLLVSNNQSVAKGQQIAKVGSTGWSTGPHLHFEVRVNGVKKNPLNYVRP